MSNISGISGIGSGSNSVSSTNLFTTQSNALLPANSPLANLDLTSNQQQQINQILQNGQSQGLTPAQVQSQINAVLTPAQQSQLQSDLQGRHHHHGGGGAAASTVSNDGTDEFGVPTTISLGNTQTIADLAAAYSMQSLLQNQND